MGILPCDDGNLIDGDGCSSVCQIEPNYICYGGTISSPDKCNSTLPLKFNKVTYYGNATVSIIFTKTVIFQSSLTQIMRVDPKIEDVFSLKIEGKIGQQFSYTWTYAMINDKTLFLYMHYQSSLTGDEVI